MWYSKSTVTKSVDLHFEGLSTRSVARYFKRHERERPSLTSVWRWIHKFARFVKRIFGKLALRLSGRWQADEMCMFIKSEPCWDWEVMDEGTRFWLASLLTEGWERSIDDAEAVLELARKCAKERPSKLTTDGLPAYERGRSWAIGWRGYEYERHVSWREGKASTNLIERKIQTTRMRTKTMRVSRAWRQVKIGSMEPKSTITS